MRPLPTNHKLEADRIAARAEQVNALIDHIDAAVAADPTLRAAAWGPCATPNCGANADAGHERCCDCEEYQRLYGRWPERRPRQRRRSFAHQGVR